MDEQVYTPIPIATEPAFVPRGVPKTVNVALSGDGVAEVGIHAVMMALAAEFPYVSWNVMTQVRAR